MTGEHLPVGHSLFLFTRDFILSTDTMAEDRANSLSALLRIALATGFSEVDPDMMPLKVL